jgi:SAM-dependent methyltransferase
MESLNMSVPKATASFLQTNYFKALGSDAPLGDTLSVDMGSGPKPKNPFNATSCLGLDIVESENIVKCNLFFESIPLANDSANFVTAFEFIEHIPRVLVIEGQARFRFVEIMSDVYRVLKPGGYFFSQTPAYPSSAVFQDPTHVNFITAQTFPIYFCHRSRGRLPGASRYGFKNGFELVSQQSHRSHLLTLLRKPFHDIES